MLNNIGHVYLAKGDFAEATTYFERALEIHEKTKNPGELAATLHNLGETLSKRGKYDDALKRYLRALDWRRGRVHAARDRVIASARSSLPGASARLKSKRALKTRISVREFWHGKF